MGITTVGVGTSVAPSVIETWCSHYLNRKPRRQKPTAHISYDLGLNLMRNFLAFAGKHSIEDVQAFTAQWAPSPHWVRREDVSIPDVHLHAAATHLQAQLGPDGIYAVGGTTWWQWRQDDNRLKAEWIEMRKDYDLREKRKIKCQRSMLYVHGGAYYFGSVDAHRYQMQRHARKLQARVLAPRYRLAPQFPFPCGLMDCLATYLFLLTVQEPETIVLAGDSAGGGMVLSMLVILRDQGLPMPAGAILLSPWVDLTHSFPSVAGNNNLDYVPANGFHHKPSLSWPPPDTDDLSQLDQVKIEMEHGKQISARALREQARDDFGKGKGKEQGDGAVKNTSVNESAHLDSSRNPSVTIDGKSIEIKDQIQFYAPNDLVSHPLVSPVLQPTLGGLPPLCVLVGSGEMLRDEQVYVAHKAANPAKYPPPSQEDFRQGSYHHSVLSSRAQINTAIARYPPTNVQLQIWDDLCHVATTLSWTRPAKYMYRSVAQFGAWALARAQMSEIRILDDDEVSMISTESSGSVDSDDPVSTKDKESPASKPSRKLQRRSMTRDNSTSRTRPAESHLYRPTTPVTVGRAGDPLPLFKDHMIRQRVTRHGDIYTLDPPSTLPACTMVPTEIGSIKPGPVKKWLAVQRSIDSRFGEVKRDTQAKRLQQMAETTGGRGMIFTKGRENSMLVGEERPPPTALAGRSQQHISEMGMLKKRKARISKGLAVWSGWGSKHDEEAIDKETEKVRRKEDVTMSVVNVRRRQSMNLLGTGPIAGGGPLDATAQPSAAGEGSSTQAIAAREKVQAPKAQTAQGAASPHASKTAASSAAVAVPVAAAGAATATTHGADGSTPVTPGVLAHTISRSQHPVVIQEPNAPPTTVPFKLARPDNLNTAQASTLTLNEADGAILPDSATLPPNNHPHYSIASTLTPDDGKTSSPATPLDNTGSHLAVPGIAGAAAGGVPTAGESANADVSRPSTAVSGASRPISPAGESVVESIVEAQPAQAQAVTMTHARAPSKGDITSVNGIHNNRPSQEISGPSAEVNRAAENDPTRAIVDETSNLGRQLTPKANAPPPEMGGLHGAERAGEEIKNAKEDSGNWAQGAMHAVADAAVDNRPERPGIERFVTAEQLKGDEVVLP